MDQDQDQDQDAKLHDRVSGLFERFQGIAPDSLGLISAYIRSHPQEFVVIEE